MGSLEQAQGQPSISAGYYPLQLNAGLMPDVSPCTNQYHNHQSPGSSIQLQQVSGIYVPVESWNGMENNIRILNRSVSYLTADVCVLSQQVNRLQQELIATRSSIPTTATEVDNNVKRGGQTYVNIGQSEPNTSTNDHHAIAEILLNLKHANPSHQRTVTNSRTDPALAKTSTFWQQGKARRRHVVEKEGANRFHCDTCKRTFRFASRLRRHLVYHSEESPFVCDVADCGKRFKTKSDLSRHSYIHKEKLQCEYCASKLATPQSLRWHVKTVHKMSFKKATT